MRERERAEQWFDVYVRMRKQEKEKIKRKERGPHLNKKIIYILQLVNNAISNLKLYCLSMPNIFGI